VIVLVLSILFLYGIHLLGLKMLSLMDEVELIGVMLKNYLLSGIFLCLLFMLIFSNVINALSTLFLSDDLDLPLASPLPLSAVFLSKFTQVGFKSAWMVLILLIPIMSAYQTNFGSPFFFHFLWPLIILPYLILCTATGMTIATIMAAMFPVRRAATAMRGIFIVGIGISIIVIRLLQPEQLVMADKFYNFGRFLMSIHSPFSANLPSYHLSRILVSFLSMDFFHLSWLVTRYIFPPLIALAISWITFSKLFKKGWMKMRTHGSSEFNDHTPPVTTNTGALTLKKEIEETSILDRMVKGTIHLITCILRLRPAEAMIMEKEALVFLRTPALWIQTAMIGVIIMIYIYNIRLLPAKSLASLRVELPSITAFCNIAFISFIVTAAALRFGFPSISMERNALFLIMSSPCSRGRYLKVKFWTSAIPLCLLALILATTSSYLFETVPLITFIVTGDTILMALAIASLALMFGVTYGNLNSADFAEIPSGWGGMIFMISSAMLSAVFLAIQAYPFYIHFLISSSIYVPDSIERLKVLFCIISSVILPLGVIYFARKRAINELPKLV
jgi:ABC-2 type transport system permease protein